MCIPPLISLLRIAYTIHRHGTLPSAHFAVEDFSETSPTLDTPLESTKAGTTLFHLLCRLWGSGVS